MGSLIKKGYPQILNLETWNAMEAQKKKISENVDIVDS